MKTEDLERLELALVEGGYPKASLAKTMARIRTSVELAEAFDLYEWTKTDKFTAQNFNPEYLAMVAKKDLAVAKARVGLMEAREAWREAYRQ